MYVLNRELHDAIEASKQAQESLAREALRQARLAADLRNLLQTGVLLAEVAAEGDEDLMRWVDDVRARMGELA